MRLKNSINNVVIIKVDIVMRENLFLNIQIVQFSSVQFADTQTQQYKASCQLNEHSSARVHKYTDGCVGGGNGDDIRGRTVSVQ